MARTVSLATWQTLDPIEVGGGGRVRHRLAETAPDRPNGSLPELKIEHLDRALETAVLLRTSEARYAQSYRRGSAFGPNGDRRRLDAFMLGVLDELGRALGDSATILPLLAYLEATLEHGPGKGARRASIRMQRLRTAPELNRYVGAGRRLVIRMLAGRLVEPGVLAELMEDELEGSTASSRSVRHLC